MWPIQSVEWRRPFFSPVEVEGVEDDGDAGGETALRHLAFVLRLDEVAGLRRGIWVGLDGQGWKESAAAVLAFGVGLVLVVGAEGLVGVDAGAWGTVASLVIVPV